MNKAIDLVEKAKARFVKKCDLSDAYFITPEEVKRWLDEALTLFEQQPEVSYTLCSRCNEKPAVICLSCLSKQPKCKTCEGHKGTIRCPECDAQICWIDIDPKKEGFVRCRRCGTPDSAFIKVPCPDCQQPPASEFTKECAKKYIYYWNGCRWDEPCGKAFKEACKIIDSLESSNTDLLKAFRPLLTAYIEPLRGENNKVVGYNLKISKKQLEVIEAAIAKATPKEKKRGGCNPEG